MPRLAQSWSELTTRYADHPGRGGCGVGAVVDLAGNASHELLEMCRQGLGCMEHRGGALGDTGDGAGILASIDRDFFTRFIAQGKHLPDGHALVVGVVFFPFGESSNLPHWQREIDAILRRAGLASLGWRHVPVNASVLGMGSLESRRDVWQVLAGEGMVPREDLPRTLHRVKAAIEAAVRECYVASLSQSTVAYKALATGAQLSAFYPDLTDRSYRASYAIFHRRFSTNTFSNWYLAQVFRMLGHNGEINTIKANRNAVANLEVELKLSHVLMAQGSDSSDMDRIVDLFVSNGVSLPETIARLVPAAWRDLVRPRPETIRWYRGVARALGSLGAWEGPAAIVATDGKHVLGALDRMGLRPMRWVVTKSGRLILGSEVGAIPVAADDIEDVGQLDPGEIVCVDLAAKKFLRPSEVIDDIVARSPMNFAQLSEEKITTLTRRAEERVAGADTPRDYLALNAFGWSWDRAKNVRHMAEHGKEPITSMGNDRPLAVFSALRPPLPKYFKQIVAVVTNPPIDPIREAGSFDLTVTLGASPTAAENTPVYEPQPGWRLPSPILTEEQLWLLCENRDPNRARAKVFDASFVDPGNGSLTGAKAIARRIAEICREAVTALKAGEATVLVFSDRSIARADGTPKRLPVPMVLLASAVHDALVEEGERRHASIVVDTGEVQEGHDVAVLVANGATAICPWLFYRVGAESGTVKNMVIALEECLQRVMSKMGICSVDGYRGSRLFEAVGLGSQLVEHWLPGVTSRIGGIELEDVYEDIVARHAKGTEPQRESDVSVYRKAVWSELQTTARGHDPSSWDRFLALVADTSPVYLRDLLQPRKVSTPTPLENVASEEEVIAAVFRGAAMSHGALHRVAHRAIAAAFNGFGAMSNCGEGGEDTRRDTGGPWDASRSRIRQVASGRFGVEARFLVHADEIQIKIGQGAKPGEGGMLPANKVTAEIAAIRRTQPGVALISPPPHHDIYSIEDLAQLIFDLRQVNPLAKLSVKIPAVTDIGTIAVGIVKAGADVIDIAGFEGGTGAASSSSIEHAGLPLERALSEVHQALTINGVRSRVKLRADGGIKTGWDVAAVLAIGADEVSLGTALMIAEQCIFCHGCAAGFCPAGITTQNDLISRRLMTEKKGRPKDELLRDEEEERYEDAKNGVERYLRALASDLRAKLSALGLTHPSQLVGRVDLLERKPIADIPGDRAVVARASKVDLSEILLAPDGPIRARMRASLHIDPTSEMNARLVADAAAGRFPLAPGETVATTPNETYRKAAPYRIANTDRAVGATLAGKLAAKRLLAPPGGFRIDFEGYAGQAFGFACVDSLTLLLTGFANDKVAEAMSGGSVVVRLPREIPAEKRGALSAAGNAAAYGATGGTLFVEGRAGQRLGVRNSGASIVVEGAGKYAFEYMTGGIGVVLGSVGPVVASGMTGGVIYLLRADTVPPEEKIHRDAKAVPMTEADLGSLRVLIEAHANATGSHRAAQLLATWSEAATRFVKVVPAS